MQQHHPPINFAGAQLCLRINGKYLAVHPETLELIVRSKEILNAINRVVLNLYIIKGVHRSKSRIVDYLIIIKTLNFGLKMIRKRLLLMLLDTKLNHISFLHSNHVSTKSWRFLEVTKEVMSS